MIFWQKWVACTDLLSANSVYCCRPVWPSNSNWVLCAFSPPLSIVAKWMRIDLWLSPAATQQKSSTSTHRKAESPRTRMLMWLYGTQAWPGENSSSGHSAVWKKSLEIEQWKKAFSWWWWMQILMLKMVTSPLSPSELHHTVMLNHLAHLRACLKVARHFTN